MLSITGVLRRLSPPLSVLALLLSTSPLSPAANGQGVTGRVGPTRPDSKRPAKKDQQQEEAAFTNPAKINVSINVRSGRVVLEGDGAPITEQFKNSSFSARNLRPGNYSLRVFPDDLSYLPRSVSIQVPAGSSTHIVNLAKRVTEIEFTGVSSTDWKLPPGWRMASGKVVVRGRGLAFPRDARFHYYKDFRLSADVKMVNGAGASFALRARDERNYYLIQLTGPNDGEPYRLRGFVVRDGVAEPFGVSFSIKHLSEVVKPGGFFPISLLIKGNVITAEVKDNETGFTLPMGILRDQDDVYPIGAAGIAAGDKDENEVGTFNLCPSCGADAQESGVAETTGAVEGMVVDGKTGRPIAGAVIQFVNTETEVVVATRSGADGRFVKSRLQPGQYLIRAKAAGFKATGERTVQVFITQSKELPAPLTLDPEE